MENEESSPSSLGNTWSTGSVWFEKFIPRDMAWGRDELLEPVPESVMGKWAVKVSGKVDIENESHEGGSLVVVQSPEEVVGLVRAGKSIEAISVPWYDRLVPESMFIPNWKTIDRTSYLNELKPSLIKSSLITIAAVVIAVIRPELKFLALILGTMWGLFPFVQSIGMALQPVDRLSVDELNRRRVNHEFFFRWIQTLKGGVLTAGTIVLVLILLV